MKRRNKNKKRVLFLSIILTVLNLPRLNNLIKQRNLYRHYLNEISKLEEDNTQLINYLESLQQDPYFTEKLLRENYGYVKEGEYIYRIQDEELEGR